MALDKESKTLGKKQYHIHLKPGDIGKYVLLPGEKDRIMDIIDDINGYNNEEMKAETAKN